MSVPKADGPVMIDGKPLDLSHLAMMTRQVEMHLPGGHKKVVRVDFHFSCHCYSRSPEAYDDGTQEGIPAGRLVPDGSVYMPRPRIFCPTRPLRALQAARRVHRRDDLARWHRHPRAARQLLPPQRARAHGGAPAQPGQLLRVLWNQDGENRELGQAVQDQRRVGLCRCERPRACGQDVRRGAWRGVGRPEKVKSLREGGFSE